MKRGLDIKVETVILQESEYIALSVVSCFNVSEIKTIMMKDHTKKFILILLQREHRQKKQCIRYINSVKNKIIIWLL